MRILWILRFVACFQPALLSKLPSEMLVEDHARAANIMAIMVENQDRFLLGGLSRMLRLEKLITTNLSER
jgi:hypothetical protein